MQAIEEGAERAGDPQRVSDLLGEPFHITPASWEGGGKGTAVAAGKALPPLVGCFLHPVLARWDSNEGLTTRPWRRRNFRCEIRPKPSPSSKLNVSRSRLPC